MATYCPSCAREMQEDFKFCPYCAQSLVIYIEEETKDINQEEIVVIDEMNNSEHESDINQGKEQTAVPKAVMVEQEVEVSDELTEIGYTIENERNIVDEQSEVSYDFEEIFTLALWKRKFAILSRQKVVFFIALIVMLIGGFMLNSINENRIHVKYVSTHNTFFSKMESTIQTMHKEVSVVEEYQDTYLRVWKNAIDNRFDTKTDKYMKKNGEFTFDVKDALAAFRKDKKYTTMKNKIDENKKQVDKTIKELKAPPAELKDRYDAFLKLYESYQAYVAILSKEAPYAQIQKDSILLYNVFSANYLHMDTVQNELLKL